MVCTFPFLSYQRECMGRVNVGVDICKEKADVSWEKEEERRRDKEEVMVKRG
jgi:hypothetical protein